MAQLRLEKDETNILWQIVNLDSNYGRDDTKI